MTNHPNRSQFKITVMIAEPGERLKPAAHFAGYVEAKRYAEWFTRELKGDAEIRDAQGNIVGQYSNGERLA